MKNEEKYPLFPKRNEVWKLEPAMLNAKLAVPKEVKAAKKRLENTIICGIRFCDYFQIFKGVCLQRFFALKKTDKIVICCEYGRRLIGGHLYAENLYWEYHGMSAATYDIYEDSYEKWKGSDAEDMTHRGASNNWTLFENVYHFNQDEFFAHLHTGYEEYKKSAEEECENPVSMMKYIVRWKTHPEAVEFLSKNGYWRFALHASELNLRGRNFQQIFGLDPQWKNDIKKMSIDQYRTIKRNKFKNLQEYNEYLRYNAIVLAVNEKDYSGRRYFSFTNEEREWVIKKAQNRHEVQQYMDYLHMADNLGYPLYRNSVHYPKNIAEAHDKAMHETDVKKNAAREKNYSKYLKELQNYAYSDRKFCIFPAPTVSSLIDESRALNHCVRTYSDKVANGQTSIFYLRTEKDVPLYTVELKDGIIPQAYGNHDKPISTEAYKFLQKWAEKEKFRITGVVKPVEREGETL